MTMHRWGAMKQLDRSGDQLVDFDEFVLWWTCTPGLGGYDNASLGFMKTKLALKGYAKTAFSKIQRKKVDNPNEFAWKGSVDPTPNYLYDGKGSDEKAAINFAVKKVEEPKQGGLSVTFKCRAKDEDAAKAVVRGYSGEGGVLERVSTIFGEEAVSEVPKATAENE